MNFASLVLIALAMSTDAFAAAIGKGAAMGKPRFAEALKIGLLFGVIEAITPMVGWAIGSVATKWVAQWDHWIAFFLLLILGARMIWAGMGGADEPASMVAATAAGSPDVTGASPSRASTVSESQAQSILLLALTAVATSIDAMAVGVGLAFVDVNIVHAAVLIGIATFTMVTLGVMLGRLLGSVIGQRAEIVGGFVLIGVGALILYEHTMT
jgi:putative Mn2+ efflux pump MntP